jgi:hypothetical protein
MRLKYYSFHQLRSFDKFIYFWSTTSQISYNIEYLELLLRSSASIGFVGDRGPKHGWFLPGKGPDSIGYRNNGTAQTIRSLKPFLTGMVVQNRLSGKIDVQDETGPAPMEYGKEPIQHKLSKTYSQGDVVGMGAGFNSYNQLVAFATLNGEFVGLLDGLGAIPDGMLLHPCVGFQISSEETIKMRFNFKGPFKSSKSIPDSLMHIKTMNYFDKIPKEIAESIVAYAADRKPFAAFTLPVVCKAWKDHAESNLIWKPLYLRFYRRQNKNLAIKNWKQFYRRRVEAVRLNQGGLNPPIEIENCGEEGQCPTVVDNLPNGSGKHRQCDKCNRTVYIAMKEHEFNDHMQKGDCVGTPIKSFHPGPIFLENHPRFEPPSFDGPSIGPPPPSIGPPKPSDRGGFSGPLISDTQFKLPSPM